eukprot:TRINITY_DN968_c0_g2_i1.p1 TRINITY_DN968_c0_g2~~TRINITY_DN968_c0_g2_i1.p1  ORF type:complete len:327 (+),score=22.93 TRINITY_DN968_c0_g2_i1:83-1063(+)
MRNCGKACRYKFPTAFFHFITVECWAIPLTAFLFNKLIVDCHVKVKTKQTHASEDPFKAYYSELLTWGKVAATTVTFNSGNPVTLPEKSWGNLRDERIWLVVAWYMYSITILLELGVICVFFARGHGPRTFEDGAYVHFTWRLPREWWYRLLVGMAAVGPIIMPLLWLIQITLDYVDDDPDLFWVNLRVLVGEWTTGVGLLFSLMRLGAFRIVGCQLRGAPQYWHVRSASDSIKDLKLRRTFPEGLIQSNTGFGSRLEDALWCAANGDITKLELCLRDRTEAESVFEMCRRDQQIESERRLQQATLRSARTVEAPEQRESVETGEL